MIHLFWVHSHINFYLSLQIIENLNIEYDKVRYIIVRNYRNQFHDLSNNSVNFSLYRENFLNRIHSLDNFYNLCIKIQNEISNLVGNQKFIFYNYAFSDYLTNIIAFHELCENVHIVEDGALAYNPYEGFYKLDKYANLKNLFNNIKNGHFKKFIFDFLTTYFYFINKKFKLYNNVKPTSSKFCSPYKKFNSTFFCIYEDAFPFVKKNKIVFGNLFVDTKSCFENDYNNCSFFIFDAIIREQYRLISEEDYLNLVFQSVSKIPKNSKLYFKFHPAQSKNLVEKIRVKILEQSKNFEELKDNIPFEQILVHHKNLTIYGFYSSLLFYALKQGHKVISFINPNSSKELIDFAKNNFNQFYQKNIFNLS